MKLAALCDFPYWEGNLGSGVRFGSLCESLAGICDLTVVCTRSLHSTYQDLIYQQPYDLIDRQALSDYDRRHNPPDIPGEPEKIQMEVRAIKHMIEVGGFDAVLTPYMNRDWMIRHIDRSVLRIIDTHDCQSQRTRSFLQHGLLPTFVISAEEEGKRLENYDIALALSDEDHNEFSAHTTTPVITAPFRLPERSLYWSNPNGNNLLFVAAQSVINDLILEYLVYQVLPLVSTPVVLHVVGNVTIPDQTSGNTRIVRHGRVEDVSYVYGRVDLAVNPAYAGGGVKTKTLEALSFGVPVVTSDEGARGLRHLIPNELIANDKETFAWMIDYLLRNPERRADLSREITQRYRSEDTELWVAPFLQLVTAAKAMRHEAIQP